MSYANELSCLQNRSMTVTRTQKGRMRLSKIRERNKIEKRVVIQGAARFIDRLLYFMNDSISSSRCFLPKITNRTRSFTFPRKIAECMITRGPHPDTHIRVHRRRVKVLRLYRELRLAEVIVVWEVVSFGGSGVFWLQQWTIPFSRFKKKNLKWL